MIRLAELQNISDARTISRSIPALVPWPGSSMITSDRRRPGHRGGPISPIGWLAMSMPKLPLRKLIAVVGAVIAGIAVSRFTGGDWMGGIAFAVVVAGLGGWYFLVARHPRDTRRY